MYYYGIGEKKLSDMISIQELLDENLINSDLSYFKIWLNEKYIDFEDKTSRLFKHLLLLKDNFIFRNLVEYWINNENYFYFVQSYHFVNYFIINNQNYFCFKSYDTINSRNFFIYFNIDKGEILLDRSWESKIFTNHYISYMKDITNIIDDLIIMLVDFCNLFEDTTYENIIRVFDSNIDLINITHKKFDYGEYIYCKKHIIYNNLGKIFEDWVNKSNKNGLRIRKSDDWKTGWSIIPHSKRTLSKIKFKYLMEELYHEK